ncbi:MAG: hypothetical protein PUB21_05010 [Bacteroidales bacterium]|nr:hypothetical protein [Bacteroidales bacterium]
MRQPIIALLFGASSLLAYGQSPSGAGNSDVTLSTQESKVVLSPDQEMLQELEALKRENKGNITVEILDVSQGAKVLKEGEEAKIHIESPEYLVKQLLGDVYAEVGHIPEPQWFEMEPIAEAYIQAFLQARTMPDGNAATQMMAEARKTFEAAIDAKLTQEQKNVREQKRAEQRAWLEKAEAQVQVAIDYAIRERERSNNSGLMRRANNTSALNGENQENVKSIQMTFK